MGRIAMHIRTTAYGISVGRHYKLNKQKTVNKLCTSAVAVATHHWYSNHLKNNINVEHCSHTHSQVCAEQLHGFNL